MKSTTTDPTRILHGIDFSGNHKMWTSGCRRSNVWIATANSQRDIVRLAELRPVQHLPGSAHPFERLIVLLQRGDYRAAAIDAPFALPARHVPAGGWPTLLRDVDRFPAEPRPFAKGADLVAYAQQNAPLEKKKPLRKTEQAWLDRDSQHQVDSVERPPGRGAIHGRLPYPACQGWGTGLALDAC